MAHYNTSCTRLRQALDFCYTLCTWKTKNNTSWAYAVYISIDWLILEQRNNVIWKTEVTCRIRWTSMTGESLQDLEGHSCSLFKNSSSTGLKRPWKIAEILKMEAIHSSKMFEYSRNTTWHNNQEDSTIYTYTALENSNRYIIQTSLRTAGNSDSTCLHL